MMKYKVGDKVRIKTWEDMKKEYGSDGINNINNSPNSFVKQMEEELNKISLNRILTIKSIRNGSFSLDYEMKEIRWAWMDEMIECLVKDYVEPIPIDNRFELLDIRR